MRNINKKEIMPGVHVIYEDDFITKLWALNDKYPDYVHCVHFDNVSEPFHKIDECKKHFKSILSVACENYMQKLTEEMQMAEEEGDEQKRLSCLANRKKLRPFKNLEVDHCKTVDEMHALIPEELRDYWSQKRSK